MRIPTGRDNLTVKKRIYFKPGGPNMMDASPPKPIEVFNIEVSNAQKDLNNSERWEDEYCTLMGYKKITPDEEKDDSVKPTFQADSETAVNSEVEEADEETESEEDAVAPLLTRDPEVDLAVEAAEAAERGVEDGGPVGGGEHDDVRRG